MSMTDPIADLLTRVRNAIHRRHDVVDAPSSRLKLEIVKIFSAEGFIKKHEVVQDGPHKTIRIHLKYVGRSQSVIRGLQRISKPGRRVYVGSDKVPQVRGGLGVAIISTSLGLMTDQASRKNRVGGEVLCTIW